MPTPREVIDSIRKRFTGDPALLEDYNEALRYLSKDLYKNPDHFTLELIQNADDNEYRPDVTPTITFRLSSERISIRNNEKGFSEANVRALCRVGRSTKVKDQGFIGEKGIGFKSVFAVSDTPEIHSNGYHFNFSVGAKNESLGYVVPYWIDNPGPDCRLPGTTLILPAQKGKRFDDATLGIIEKELLLFLRRLQVIEVSSAAHDRTERFEKETVGSTTIIRRQVRQKVPGPISTDKFRLVQHEVDVTDIVEPKREGFKKSEIVLGFPLGTDDSAAPDQSSKVFAFLPIREYGFRFLIQGDFLLSSSREDVHGDLPWNQRLREQIPDAFIRALAEFKKDVALSRTYYRYLPKESEVSDSFFAPVAEELYARLAKEPCLLGESGTWLRPDQVLRKMDSCDDLISNKELKSLLSCEYLSEDAQVTLDVFKKLGGVSFEIAQLLKCLSNKTWLHSHNPNWFSRLYIYLGELEPDDKEIEALKQLEIIPLENGTFTSLNDGTVFLPLAGQRKYGFEAELQVIAGTALPIKATERMAATELLKSLGVRSASPAEIIDGHILALHKGEQWKESEHDALLGHISYVKDHLSDYLTAKTADVLGLETQSSVIASLTSTLRISVQQDPDADPQLFSHADSLYLGDAYGYSHPLATLFAGVKECSFASSDYLTKDTSSPQSTRVKEWRSFLRTIGAAELPRVVETGGQGIGPLRGTLPASSKGYTFKDFAPSPELTQVLTSTDRGVRTLLLQILDKEWERYYSAKTAGTISGRYYNSRNESKCASSFLNAVGAMLVPTSGGTEAKFFHTYLDTPAFRDIFGANVPYLAVEIKDQNLLTAAGVKCQVDAGTAIEALRDWRNRGGASIEGAKRMYRLIHSHTQSADLPRIKQLFAQEPLIFLGGEPAAWIKSSDACWQSYGRILKKYVSSIEAAYPDFKEFFVDLLGIEDTLSSARLVQILTAISKSELPPNEAGLSAQTIYTEISDNLRREEDAGQAEAAPSWAAEVRNGLLWTNKDDFWSDDEDVFVNDMPDLADLFRDSPKIAFLAVEPARVPRLRRLLELCSLRRLSESLKRTLPAGSKDSADGHLTSLLRSRSRQIAEYIYAHDHGQYENLLTGGAFAQLKALTVYVVPELEIEVSLNEEAARARVNAIVSNGDLFIAKDYREDLDAIAQELAKWLEAPEIGSFLSLILMQRDQARMKRLFSNHNIPALPDEELQRLDFAPAIATEVISEQVEEAEKPAEELPSSLEAPQPDPEEEPATPDSAPPTSRTLASSSSSPNGRSASDVEAPQSLDTASGEDATPESGAQSDEPPTVRSTPDSREDDANGIISERRQRRKSDSDSIPPQPRRDRVPVYVSPRDASDSDGAEGAPRTQEEKDWLIRLGQAAVDVVCTLEEGAGWAVKRMSQTHEGYDLEASRDGATRYIEVKGLKGPWAERGVGLSKAQFECARTHQDDYWLYVVENALATGSPTVTRIQNPAKRITEYRFDHSWQQLSVESGVGRQSPQDWTGRTINLNANENAVIETVQAHGLLTRLQVKMADGASRLIIYNPATMTILPQDSN